MIRIFSITILFYVLVLLQMSFYVHVLPSGMMPNFVIITALLITLFENPRSNGGIIAAIAGGFLLDMFSGGFIGFWTLILLGSSLLIKIVLENYVRAPILKKI